MQQSLNIKTYLFYAIYIVATTPGILLFIVILGLVNGISFYIPESSFADFVEALSFFATIFASPVIYGMYFEKIEDKNSSIATIFRTYVPGYILLLLSMYIPIAAATAVVMTATGIGGSLGYIMIIILVFSLVFLYVVPSYFLTRKIITSISSGVQFLLRNLLCSAPVLLMALFSELLLLLSRYQLVWLKEKYLTLYVLMDFTVYLIASILDFLLFIILMYILKNHTIKEV